MFENRGIKFCDSTADGDGLRQSLFQFWTGMLVRSAVRGLKSPLS